MKMIYGGVPVKSMKAHVFDVNSNDATMIASDLQAGVSAYAKGKKVIGTGKSFEFATYGYISSNDMWPIPTETINVVHVSSLDYPTQQMVALHSMKDIDFSTSPIISKIIVNGVEYPVSVSSSDNMFEVICDITTNFQIFYGKDNYV